MAREKRKRSAKKPETLPVKRLDGRQAKGVRGGTHKHLAGVKYEDITINSGTGMSKTTS
jgi:hypothetical protein